MEPDLLNKGGARDQDTESSWNDLFHQSKGTRSIKHNGKLFKLGTMGSIKDVEINQIETFDRTNITVYIE